MTREAEERFDTLLRAVANSPSIALPGTTVLGDRFLLQRRLGEGGFGVVYEAEDLRDGGRVALKMLRHAQDDWLYRFKREFRALQGLAHPNLVVLDELFGENGRWFFTMELVDGVDFVRHTSCGPKIYSFDGPSVSQVRTTHNAPDVSSAPAPAKDQEPTPAFDEPKLRDGLRQLFEGLAVLHAARKVHRDIKPSNVLVTREGRLVLIDFGLVTDAFHATSSAMIGTPAYMAPEQAGSREVGPAADLYAVGVMLYELLTGRMPFEGPALQILLDKQTREPPSLASIVSGIPEDLSALCTKLLHFDPTQRPTTAEACRSLAAMPIARSVLHRRSTTAAIFVGRSAELCELNAAFETSTMGRPATVLVSGESGIGKTHLVRRFVGRVLAERADAMVLEGRCHEREAIPYKALDGIIDTLSRRLSRMPASAVAALLPTRRSMLARIFPAMLRISELSQQSANPDGSNAPQSELRQRGFLELRELFTRIAMNSPTVVFIDDLQWADDDGLRALAEILRPPDAPPLLFIGAARLSRGEGKLVPERLRAVLPSDVRVIEVTNLGKEDARELAASLLGPVDGSDVEVESIAKEAGGHPLFVEELARHTGLSITRDDVTLDSILWSRILRLELPAREVVELIAVAGKPLPQQVAAAATRLEPAEFQRRVAVLRASNLARTAGARWADAIEPYHDRVREAVLARIEPVRRRALHEALATAFEDASQLDAETLAMHWREAGNGPRAASYAAAAGDLASRAFAFDRATVWFEQALDLLPQGHSSRRELRVKLGDALAFAGRGALAAPHFEAAAAESSAVEALELRRRAAEQLLRSGHFDRGMEASRVVLASMGMRMPATRFHTMVSVVYFGFLLRLRGLRFRQRDPDQITNEDRTRIDTCWSIAVVLGFVEILVGMLFLRRALLLALKAGDLERVTRAVALDVGFNAASGGRSWRRTERLLQHARDLAARSGSLQARVWVIAAEGVAFYLNGRFGEAAETFVRLFDMLEDGSMGLAHERGSTRMFLIQSLFYLGRFKELRLRQDEGLRDARARGDVYAAVCLRTGHSNMAWLVEDRPDLADRETRAAMSDWSTRGFHLEHFYALSARVWISVYVGDVAEAYALAEELLERTKRSFHWRIQNVRLRVLYARGASALAMLERRMGNRKKLLREAMRDAGAIERERMEWMQPFAKILRAGIALRQGARDEALTALAAAARAYDEHGMSAYAAAARDRAARLRGDASSPAEFAQVAEQLRAKGSSPLSACSGCWSLA